jgi:hypothetical protein
MNQPQIIELIIMIAAAITATTVIFLGVKKIAGFIKKVVHFFDDFIGEEERSGVPARPGFSERMSKMESCMEKVDERLGVIEYRVAEINYELQPNSGHSAKDAINRIEKRLNDIEARINV